MLPSRDDLERIYRVATDSPFSVLYVDLRATDVNAMFCIGFSKRLRVNIGNQEMQADPFSTRPRDTVRGPVRGDLARPAETVVKPMYRGQPQYGRESSIATPHQLQRQGVLRKQVPTG